MSNHLGNVLAVITDRRIQTCGLGDVMHYEAQVVSISDYYPFGMGIKDREWKDSTFSYRFGFNGKEKDDEVNGAGNVIAFEARIFDSRLGRFLSTDPWEYKYVWQTPYAYFKNSPISTIDNLGMGGVEPTDDNIQIDPLDKGLSEGSLNSEMVVQNSMANLPYFLEQGTAAHNAFTSYFRRMDPNEKWWTADKTVSGADDPSRPDLVYDNKVNTAGVWELKPSPPSPSAPLAPIQAAGYAASLNAANNTTRFMTGSSGGAPLPIKNGIILIDPKSKRVFEYNILNPNDGGVYWTEINPPKVPVPEPVVVTVPKPEPSSDKPVPVMPIISPRTVPRLAPSILQRTLIFRLLTFPLYMVDPCITNPELCPDNNKRG